MLGIAGAPQLWLPLPAAAPCRLVLFFFVRSHLSGTVLFASGSCCCEFELHRERKKHRWEPGWSLIPVQLQHGALPAATSAPVLWFWPQSLLLLSAPECEGCGREQQGDGCQCHRRQGPGHSGARSPLCGRLFWQPWLQEGVGWHHGLWQPPARARCPQPLCSCPPFLGNPRGTFPILTFPSASTRGAGFSPAALVPLLAHPKQLAGLTAAPAGTQTAAGVSCRQHSRGTCRAAATCWARGHHGGATAVPAAHSHPAPRPFPAALLPTLLPLLPRLGSAKETGFARVPAVPSAPQTRRRSWRGRVPPPRRHGGTLSPLSP